MLVTAAGFLGAALSVYMPWARLPGLDVTPLLEHARFRLGDSLAKDNLDGYVVAGLAMVALLATLLQPTLGRLTAAALGRLGGLAGALLIPVGLAEVQFVLSKPGVEVGNGLWLMLGASMVASVGAALPRKR